MQDRQNSHLDLRLETPLEEAFFPEPKLVTPDYWAYARWRFLQRVASSVITVLATQQMLFAVALLGQVLLPTLNQAKELPTLAAETSASRQASKQASSRAGSRGRRPPQFTSGGQNSLRARAVGHCHVRGRVVRLREACYVVGVRYAGCGPVGAAAERSVGGSAAALSRRGVLFRRGRREFRVL